MGRDVGHLKVGFSSPFVSSHAHPVIGAVHQPTPHQTTTSVTDTLNMHILADVCLVLNKTVMFHETA
jgi:hypothetical protein